MRKKTRGGVGAFVLVAVAAACSSSSSDGGGGTTGPGPGGTTPAQGTVGASGGKVATPDGLLTVNVPAGALPADTTITIAEIPAPAPGAIGKTYEIGPTGTQFAVPVTLTFEYGAADLQGNDPASLEVATIANGEWVGLAGDAVDTAAQVATGQTTHLSPYGIHVRAKINGGDDSGAVDATVADADADASSDSSVDDSGSDSGPIDSGSDASGCIHGAQQVGSCQNHPVQICISSYYFTNCVNQAPQGFTYDCCPGG